MKHKHKVAYMECAESFARCSVGIRLQVGAILVKDGGIISEGYNGLYKALHGPLEDDSGKTKATVVHGERNALRKLQRSTNSAVGSTLFVTHSPCELCSYEVIDAGVVAVYFREWYRDAIGVKTLLKHGVEVFHFPCDDSINTLRMLDDEIIHTIPISIDG